ncbi:beta-lactamase family protein [Streptomyces sp. NBC_01317]|uniref:serine hydrolase domain-containing protein n=1 Tax=Streptomyces sp. NBC_01317 TaxID=2903822 RepID=UPI002E136CC5|nr:beta-lactamase family protein [Streptomyces sp. NBC_01317]
MTQGRAGIRATPGTDRPYASDTGTGTDSHTGAPPGAWALGPASPVVAAARGASAVAVALRRGHRRAVVTHGRTAREGGAPVTADTRFEIGSLTKCLTALLFAERAARGEVAHGDPLTRFLPPEAVPEPRGGPVTLLHLATHTSGLPRLPPGLFASATGRWLSNPYARFDTDDLLDALARTRLRARPGERMRYSNFGVALLGHLLTGTGEARTADGTARYGDLLAARVLDPLGLHGTSCVPGPPGTTATGHGHGGARPPWEIPGLPGAGAVRSTARDLLTLLDAHLEAHPGAPPGTREAAAPLPLRAALADVTRPRLAVRGGARRLALVWNIRVRPGGDVYHHSGGTSGFTAFAGFCPRRGTALVALANTTPDARHGFLQSAYEALLALGARG